jgi:xanthine/uracil/vitamin C permease (AzgA family)
MERKKIGVFQAFKKAIPHFIQVGAVLVLIYSILDNFHISGNADYISGDLRMYNIEEGMLIAVIIYIVGKILEIRSNNLLEE